MLPRASSGAGEAGGSLLGATPAGPWRAMLSTRRAAEQEVVRGQVRVQLRHQRCAEALQPQLRRRRHPLLGKAQPQAEAQLPEHQTLGEVHRGRRRTGRGARGVAREGAAPKLALGPRGALCAAPAVVQPQHRQPGVTVQLEQGRDEALADPGRRGRVLGVRGLEVVADHRALLPPPLRVAPLLALREGRPRRVLAALLLRGLLELDSRHADPAHVGHDLGLELLQRRLQVGEGNALVRQHGSDLGRGG